MIFYQTTTNNVTLEMLKDFFFKDQTTPHIQEFHFLDFPNIQTLDEALHIIDEKRQTLKNPYQHSFICIKFLFEESILPDIQFFMINSIAETLNTYHDNDLFISTMLYSNDPLHIRNMILLSDIERSLSESSSIHFSYTQLPKIINDTLTGYYVSEIVQNALYLFNGDNTELAYDGIIVLQCDVKKIFSQDNF